MTKSNGIYCLPDTRYIYIFYYNTTGCINSDHLIDKNGKTMKCPYCGSEENKVVDSRSSKEGRSVRRRRECLDCVKRYTTYEYIENVAIMVVKRDGRTEDFDRQKLFSGIKTACKKRPISIKKIESIVDKIVSNIETLPSSEVKSSDIGEFVMKELNELDDVAYVRFASVYRQFKDRNEFLNELKELEATDIK